jgi:hypothetical protein
MNVRGRRFTSSRTLESKPTPNSRCDGNRSLHVWVNVAVICERSRRRESKNEGLIRRQIAGGSEDNSRITGDSMWGIGRIGQDHLRSCFDRECCRSKSILVMSLNDLHIDHVEVGLAWVVLWWPWGLALSWTPWLSLPRHMPLKGEQQGSPTTVLPTTIAYA